MHVEGEVAVAELEPGRLAEPRELPGGRPRLAFEAPPTLPVGQARQRVQDGVVVRADPEAVEVLVVAGVDDHGQVAGRDDELEPERQLGPADAAGERDDPRTASVRPSPRHVDCSNHHVIDGSRSLAPPCLGFGRARPMSAAKSGTARRTRTPEHHDEPADEDGDFHD